MYKIKISSKALKSLNKLPSTEITRISNFIDSLEGLSNPVDLPNCKKLKGMLDVYRYRVGNYRVIVKKETDNLVILVLHIGHRQNIYKQY